MCKKCLPGYFFPDPSLEKLGHEANKDTETKRRQMESQRQKHTCKDREMKANKQRHQGGDIHVGMKTTRWRQRDRHRV